MEAHGHETIPGLGGSIGRVMTKSLTTPEVQEVVTKALLSWKQGGTYIMPSDLREGMEEAFLSKNK